MFDNAAVDEPEGSCFVVFADRPRRLHLSGELDMAGAPDLVNALGAAIRLGGTIELHLAALSFMDSSGINALVHAVHGLGDRGRLVLFDPTPAVQRVIDLCGLRDTFEIGVAPAA